jgi:uncharacterized membrane protein
MIQEYIKFIIILIAIDSIWLFGNYESHKFQFESIQKSPLQIDKLAGLLFYVVAAISYFKFIKPQSLTKEDAFKNGLLMGFLLYSSFDLTNKAVFTNYKWDYAIKDILWGSHAIGLASYFMF